MTFFIVYCKLVYASSKDKISTFQPISRSDFLAYYNEWMCTVDESKICLYDINAKNDVGIFKL